MPDQPQPWSDRLHNYLANLMTTVAIAAFAALTAYLQTHPVPMPVVQTAPVPVVVQQPAKLTLEQLQDRLKELQAEAKGK